MKFNPTKGALSKWLFTAILILGFFTFSGFAVQIANRFDKPHTTLVTSSVKKVFRSISYSVVLKKANRNMPSYLISVYCDVAALSFLHSRNTIIQLKEASGLFILNEQIGNPFFISTHSLTLADSSHLFLG